MANEIFLVRSETISGFNELVRELGAEPEPLYNKEGLTGSLFDNPDYMVPYASICRLLDTTAKTLDQENFGLLLANRREEFPIGILGTLVRQSPDVKSAMETASEHFHLHSQGLMWRLDVERDYAFLNREDRISGEVPTFQYAVLSMCTCYRALRMLCGGTWHPSTVTFTHAPPRGTREYSRFFGIKVSFNQEFTRFVFPASVLGKELSGHDGQHHDLLTTQVEEMEAEYESQQELWSRAKRLIQQYIHSDNCTQSTVATALGMHPKKLQRELNRQQLSFRELRAEVRLDMAERYLKDSDIPLTIIAEILGYSELSCFSHAFKTRHRLSPLTWRNRERSSEATRR